MALPFRRKEVRRPLPLCQRGKSAGEDSSPGRAEESVQEKVPPLAGRKDWARRLGSPSKVKDDQCVACVSCEGIPCPLPGTCMEDARQKHAAAGKQRASLHAIGAVNADETE
jgi:hypothetical protein